MQERNDNLRTQIQGRRRTMNKNVNLGANVVNPHTVYANPVAIYDGPGTTMCRDAWTCNDGSHQWRAYISCTNEDIYVVSFVLL